MATAEANIELAQTTASAYQELRKTGLVARRMSTTRREMPMPRRAARVGAPEPARLEQLESFSRVTAPFDGVVTARRIDIGALVAQGNNSGQELFHMTATNRLRIYVQVPQAYADLIQPGMVAELSFPERPDRRFTAKVVSTARAIDGTTRTLLTELEADNSKGELLPGSFVQVHLQLPAGVSRWRLPSNTLLFRADGLHVAAVGADDRVVLKKCRSAVTTAAR